MKPRLSTAIFWLLAVALLIGAGMRQRELGQLRVQSQQLASESAQNEKASEIENVAEPVPDTTVPTELLRLRNEVSQLMTRRRGMSDLRTNNQQLTAALAARGTNNASLPPGYVRARDAQWMGMSTPENTFQSFLWAIQKRDQAALLRLITPESAAKISQELAQNPGKFFGETPIPGFRPLKQTKDADIFIRMQIEIIPGQEVFPGAEINFRQIDGEWRMDIF